MHSFYLSLGSNIGDRTLHLKQALRMLEEKKIKILKISSTYETEPVGYKDQEWFYNIAIFAQGDYSAEVLLKIIGKIENALDRKREIPLGPRTIDIDILFYENEILDSQKLQIPHPRLHERKFVLIPMAEIVPSFQHPVLQETMSELLKKLANQKGQTVYSLGKRL